MSDRSNLYADSFLSLIRAEGHGNEVIEELSKFSQVLDGSEELRHTLSDPHLPVERRQQIVEDLLSGKANPVTSSIVSVVVGNGRVRELPEVVDRLLERSSSTGDATIAQVRTAVALTDDQKARLAAALTKSAGRTVEIVEILDPSVLGGIVTQIGDTVIDGSVRQRLSQLRETF